MSRNTRTQELGRREFLGLAGLAGASLLLAACGGSQEGDAEAALDADATEELEVSDESAEEQGADGADADASQDAPAATAAIVCFSWSGNTRSMADRIAEHAGVAVWDLVPVDPYPEEYNACTDEALAEQQAGTLRAYQGDVEGWDSIDTVYLGYPIWWMDLPQITKAFIANHDWAGKTVVPFSSYYNSGWSGTPEAIAETCEGATVVDGISLAQGSLPGGLDEIDAWFANA